MLIHQYVKLKIQKYENIHRGLPHCSVTKSDSMY